MLTLLDTSIAIVGRFSWAARLVFPFACHFAGRLSGLWLLDALFWIVVESYGSNCGVYIARSGAIAATQPAGLRGSAAHRDLDLVCCALCMAVDVTIDQHDECACASQPHRGRGRGRLPLVGVTRAVRQSRSHVCYVVRQYGSRTSHLYLKTRHLGCTHTQPPESRHPRAVAVAVAVVEAAVSQNPVCCVVPYIVFYLLPYYLAWCCQWLCTKDSVLLTHCTSCAQRQGSRPQRAEARRRKQVCGCVCYYAASKVSVLNDYITPRRPSG